MTSQEHNQLIDTYGAHNYSPLPVVVAKAEGSWVWDVEGNRYLDCLAGYSALNHGHRHPRLIAALKAQADRVTLTSRAFNNDQLGPFFAELSKFVGLPKILPMNTGAEAVETAIKAARKWGYQVKGVASDKAHIVVCADNFHGRTTTIVSFSTDPQARGGFGPYTPGFTIVDYGDIKALERALTPDTVAFLVEPIQGEAGIHVPPNGYLAAVRALTAEHNVLLMVDEIQSGFGRTGRDFCYQHEDVQPDVVILGKALGGGVLPVSAIAASDEIMGVFQPGDHGSTFGGNPLACAVAREALKVFVEDGLTQRSAELGPWFMDSLRALDSPKIKDIRGRGLWVGVELHPEAGTAKPYCKKLMSKGVLCKDTHEQVIRFAPPLVIGKDDLEWALERIGDVLA